MASYLQSLWALGVSVLSVPVPIDIVLSHVGLCRDVLNLVNDVLIWLIDW